MFNRIVKTRRGFETEQIISTKLKVEGTDILSFNHFLHPEEYVRPFHCHIKIF